MKEARYAWPRGHVFDRAHDAVRSLPVALLVALAAACGDDAAGPGAGGSGGAGGGDAGASNDGGAGASLSAGGSPAQGGEGGDGVGGHGGEGGSGGDPFPPGEPDCHPRESSAAHGAYFRKVTSSADPAFRTIHVVGSLPRVIIDRDRWYQTDVAGQQWKNGPLDRPSLYLGGRASGVEVDAGLTWDRVYDAQGRATWTDELDSGSDGDDAAHRFVLLPSGAVESAEGVPRPEGLSGLVENFAFRAFWRAQGVWANPPVGSESNKYYYPGQGFRMQLRTAGAGLLELTMNDDGPMDEHGQTAKFIQQVFDAPGWGVGAAQLFKRVNSIDQFTVIEGERVGLETADLDVLPTRTRAIDGEFLIVRILGENGVLMGYLDCDATAVVGSDAILATGYDDIFLLYAQSEIGGERSIIVPPSLELP